jgi:hypothetical protein
MTTTQEYIGFLSASFNSDSTIIDPNFDWRIIRNDFFAADLGTTNYENIINADYDSGVTPYKITNTLGTDSTETIVGFAHDVEMPYFTADGGSFIVNYDSVEEEALKNQFHKEDFFTSYDNKINAMATNLYNKSGDSLGFSFNKTRKKPLDLKDVRNMIDMDVTDSSSNSTNTMSTDGSTPTSTTSTGGSTTSY